MQLWLQEIYIVPRALEEFENYSAPSPHHLSAPFAMHAHWPALSYQAIDCARSKTILFIIILWKALAVLCCTSSQEKGGGLKWRRERPFFCCYEFWKAKVLINCLPNEERCIHLRWTSGRSRFLCAMAELRNPVMTATHIWWKQLFIAFWQFVHSLQASALVLWQPEGWWQRNIRLPLLQWEPGFF